MWDSHVANNYPKDLREVVWDKQVVRGAPSAGTKYGDLTPFDLKYFDDPIPYERFLRSVRMERDILPPGHTSLDFVVKREFYPVLLQKFGSDAPNMDVFGASGATRWLIAPDSASDSDTASFHSVCSDPEMFGFATDAPDSVCSNPEVISGSADSTTVIVTRSDLQSFLSSDICQCTTCHWCSCQVGRDAWSAVRRVRPGIIGPSTPPVLLPFQRNQHSRVATRAQHVLGSGRVRTYDPWQDASPSREDFSPSSHSQATYVQRVAESDDPSQDTECVKYRSRLEDEYKQDVLSGVVPYREHDIFRGPYGYARVQLKAGALPKRQRPFSHIGERGEALGEIICINLHKGGWHEELSSGSEWCPPPFTVPKPVPKKTALSDKWRMVIDFRYLNCQTQDD